MGHLNWQLKSQGIVAIFLLWIICHIIYDYTIATIPLIKIAHFLCHKRELMVKIQCIQSRAPIHCPFVLYRMA